MRNSINLDMKQMNLIGCLLLASVMFITSCESKKTSEEANDSTEVATEEQVEATEEEKDDAPIASPRKKAEGTIDGVSVVMDYGSPAVKDRKIWGGLEEYGVVWRAGANETTAVEFGSDVMIDGTRVEAGKYGIYLIPNENADWIVILNTDWDREKHGSWGAYNYTEENDVLRVEVSPEWSEDNQERLTYTIEADGLGFAWEKARLKVPVSNASAE